MKLSNNIKKLICLTSCLFTLNAFSQNSSESFPDASADAICFKKLDSTLQQIPCTKEINGHQIAQKMVKITDPAPVEHKVVAKTKPKKVDAHSQHEYPIWDSQPGESMIMRHEVTKPSPAPTTKKGRT